MKKTTKKLILKADTIRNLSPDTLGRVIGGISRIPQCASNPCTPWCESVRWVCQTDVGCA